MDAQIVNQARQFVEEYYDSHKSKSLHYHNLEHTRYVADAAETIGKASGLNGEELEIALVAAWCHDIGHNEGDWPHEDASVRVTTGFLRSIGYPEKKISEVAACIYATRIPQAPENLMQQTLCDADMAHLAGDRYFEIAEKLRREISELSGRTISAEDWLKENKEFFAAHRYFTSYARQTLQPLKDRNMLELAARLSALVH